MSSVDGYFKLLKEEEVITKRLNEIKKEQLEIKYQLKTEIVGEDLFSTTKVIGESIDSGYHGGDGPFTKKTQKLIEDTFGIEDVEIEDGVLTIFHINDSN